ncbi:MAG: HAD-IA family hydrolase [Polyangiaceae bacterium]|nr:HAD-IA family hydrolase [Polyangiaceae bacterium]
MLPPTHVIFDLDGVLLDTEPLYTRATQAVVDEFGVIFDWKVKAGMIGRSDAEGARHLVESLGIALSPDEYLRRRGPILDRLFQSAPEMPGARALVAGLKGRRVPLGVATSSAHHQFRAKTAHHDWFGAFDAIVCGDDPRVAAPKPAPDIFLVTARELGAEPARCVVFEDSLSGVAAAQAAGMRVAALPDPAVDAGRFAHADWVFGGLADVSLEALGF